MADRHWGTDTSQRFGIICLWKLNVLFQLVCKESPSRKDTALSCSQGSAEPSAAQSRNDGKKQGYFILLEAKGETDQQDYPGGAEPFPPLYLIQLVCFLGFFLAYRHNL